MLKVQVYNGNMQELYATTPARARLLVKRKKAVVICIHPFTIRLKYLKL